MKDRLINKKSLIRYIHQNGLRVGDEIVLAVDKRIKEILEKTFERTKKNKRKCIKEHDI